MKNIFFIIFMFVMFCWATANIVQSQETWTDTEYETNKQCSYLRGEELEKCKLHFNLT